MAGAFQRVIDRAGDYFRGQGEAGAIVSSRAPSVSGIERRGLVETQHRSAEYRSALSKARLYATGSTAGYASDQTGRADALRLSRPGPRSHGAEMKVVRERCRQVAILNHSARRSINILTAFTVRTGTNRTPKPSKRSAKAVTAAMKWFRTRDCDVLRKSNMFSLEWTAIQTMFRDGEVLVRLRWRKPEDGLAVPLAVEILDCDYLYDGAAPAGVKAGNFFAAGIEFSPIGHPEAYWLYKSHPLDPMTDRTPVRVPVIDPRTGLRQIAHIFDPEFAGQIRGVPLAAIAIETVYDAHDLRRSLLDRKRAEAKRIGVITAPENVLRAKSTVALPGGQVYDPETGETRPAGTTEAAGGTVTYEDAVQSVFEFAHAQMLENTTILPMLPGWDYKETVLTTATDYASFQEDLNRTIATSFEVPYEFLTGDISKANFSSSKFGVMPFKAKIEHIQEIVLHELSEFVWDGFCLAGQLAGLWKERSIECVHSFDRFPSVDLLKDLAASKLEMQLGIKSPRVIAAEYGQDYAVTMAETKEDLALARDAGHGIVTILELAEKMTGMPKRGV